MIGKAQSAQELTKLAEIEEKIGLAVIKSTMERDYTVRKETFTSELNKQFGTEGKGWAKTEIDENTWKILIDENVFKVDLTTGAIEKTNKEILSDITKAEIKSNIEIAVNDELDVLDWIINKNSIEKCIITEVTENVIIKSATTIKATEEGNAKITIKGTQSGYTKDIILTAVKLRIGSYVNYDVTYKDVYSEVEYNNSTNGNFGWRILDLGNYNETTKTYTNTKIISTGIPAVLHYNSYDITKYVNNGRRKMGRR